MTIELEHGIRVHQSRIKLSYNWVLSLTPVLRLFVPQPRKPEGNILPTKYRNFQEDVCKKRLKASKV